MYYRLDPMGIDREDLLNRIILLIRYRIPSMFGFTVFSSISQARTNGNIPYPHSGDSAAGGHAIIAMGYDDGKEIKHSVQGSKKRIGALQFRNSRGDAW